MAKPTKKLSIVVNDESTQEVVFSIRTTRAAIITMISLAVALVGVGSYFLISRTGLRRTMPGYPSAETRMKAIENVVKIDSLERVIDMWAFQVGNIRRIAGGRDPLPPDSMAVARQEVTATGSPELYFSSDSILRAEVAQRERSPMQYGQVHISQIEGLHFFTPVKGIVSEPFSETYHPYIDITATSGTMIFSVLDGTVISSSGSDGAGYTIEVMHDNDIVSIYKRNGKLLRRVGDKVTAGTPIAIAGGTGAGESGVHLHFELWHKGEAIDPAIYIKF